jgi:magnesium transporter
VQSSESAASQAGSLKASCLHNAGREEITAHLKDQRFFWLDLEDPSDEKLKEVADTLSLHPLTLDDMRVFRERPKIEEYDGYVFLVVYGVDPGVSSGSPLLREVHLVISGDYVISVHRSSFTALNELRERYGEHQFRSEQMLIYKILDAVINTFIPVLSRIDDDIDEIEQAVIQAPTEESLQRIFALKRDLVAMRRVVTPMRDVFARDAERIGDLPGLQDDGRLYFRDVYDTLIRVSDLVDSYRDLLSGATDMYLSTVANRQNEVNKQLTIIATVFLPLSFLTGFFGQNFTYLVRDVLGTTWSFWLLGIGLLVVSVVTCIVFFRRKGWM